MNCNFDFFIAVFPDLGFFQILLASSLQSNVSVYEKRASKFVKIVKYVLKNSLLNFFMLK